MGINISISNFAKIKKANVTINGLTVISGENDTGKSTVGKAVYSLIKSINTYKTSGINIIKKAILNQMEDSIRLIGRLMQRKTKNFTHLEIRYFIIFQIHSYMKLIVYSILILQKNMKIDLML